jgi:hypothetical protein
MSLAERVPADRKGFTVRETAPEATTLAGFLDGADLGRDFFTANLGKTRDGRSLNVEQVQSLAAQLIATAPIYMAIDTYLALVFQLGIFKPEQVAGVFPWAAEAPCKIVPKVSPTTDAICRNTALYFWQLHHHPMQDWDGKIRTFSYRASNTLSYRAKAPYHNVERSLRARIRPPHPDRFTVQFDWSAAEFNLILQHLGYQPPEDAYGLFVADGLDRDLTKKTILAYIYGALHTTLYANAGGDARNVDRILARLQEVYPLVNEWREQCISSRLAEFNGFHYDLGDTEYKRPNHWAQTALQLCKWELMSRLACAGVHLFGSGDLHDQLYFDVDPIKERDAVAEIVKQVRMPAFGRYNLRPQFKSPTQEWG